MNNALPDCYLASSDVYQDADLARPRKCWRINSLRGESRDDYLLIQIDPPIIGQPYGLGARDIHEVILASKSRLVSLLNITSWPVPVYVLYTLIEHPERRDVIHDDEFHLLVWAELYETWEDALKVSQG
jgi:hypothetical protein